MSSGSLFDPLADAYDQARPGYPEQLFVDLEMLACQPVEGARAAPAAPTW